MAFEKKSQKPEIPLDPEDPAVKEAKRMEQDQIKAEEVARAEQDRIRRIAAEDAEKIAQEQKTREAQDKATQSAQDAARVARLKTPLSQDEQEELAGLEIEARSGHQVEREQMIRLGELRERAEVKKK